MTRVYVWNISFHKSEWLGTNSWVRDDVESVSHLLTNFSGEMTRSGEGQKAWEWHEAGNQASTLKGEPGIVHTKVA